MNGLAGSGEVCGFSPLWIVCCHHNAMKCCHFTPAASAVVFAIRMKKFVTVAAISCAIIGAPAIASATPVQTTPIADSGSSPGGSGSSDAELICSPIAQLLFSTGSVEKPPLYDLLCLLT
ncbi:hypothetical protein [Nocardia fluminea]|uniref:hypothetical protein n=1 Tax=Nocardia fluminea TaxID=134984 RepID=UPI00342EA393